MTDINNLFIELLKCGLYEKSPEQELSKALTPEVLLALYEKSKKQDMAHIVAAALKNLDLPKESIPQGFKKQEMLSIMRSERMKHEFQRICGILSDAQIPFIPLKGSVIRPFYPKDYMRTSCDIDILVREENLENAVEHLTDEGFKIGERDYHNISLFSSAGVHLELHFSILENIDKVDCVLKDAWDYAKPIDGFKYGFTDDFFCFYNFAHLSFHFLTGGCGIRFLTDLHIIETQMGIKTENARVLLEKGGIYKFATEMTELSKVVFGGGQPTDFQQNLIDFILGSGVFGELENRIAMAEEEKPATAVYIFKRLFMPMRSMKIAYPILQKIPLLLPVLWVHRILKMLLGKKKGALSEIKTAGGISQDKTARLNEMKNKLEL